MENAIKDRFMFTYESGVTGSFLVVGTSKEDSVVEFQLNMLAKNPNKHILNLDVRRNNDRVNIYYNVTSKISLSQYLKRSQLSKNEFVDIFLGIVKTLLNSKGLLLSDNSFLLDEEFVYISPDTMCTSLVYLPVKLDIDITKALRDFSINFVVYSANIYEDNSDNFLQQFLSFLKKDTFNILDFDKFLREMKREIGKQHEADSNKSSEIAHDGQKLENIDMQQKKESDSKQNKSNVDIPRPKVVESKDSKKDIPSNSIKSKVELKKSEASVESKNIINSIWAKPNLVIGVLIQVIIVIIVLVLFLSGKLDSLGNDKVATVFGLVLISCAVSYFMWKNVLKIKVPNKKDSPNRQLEVKNLGNKTRSSIPNPKQVERPSRANKNNEAKISDDTKKVILNNKRTDISNALPKVHKKDNLQELNRQPIEEKKHVDTSIKVNSNLNETVLLGGLALKHPHLQIFMDSGVDDIAINKPSFIIGRLEEQVDYVHSNNAIGKVHAEIISRDGCFYLKDLNSKNGTYINGKRIDSNKEYELKNNDKLTLANSEFVFRYD